jgi:putative transposase
MCGESTFKWQGGYGAFTVSKQQVPRIREYILRQKEHHRVQTFDEALEFSRQPGS